MLSGTNPNAPEYFMYSEYNIRHMSSLSWRIYVLDPINE